MGRALGAVGSIVGAAVLSIGVASAIQGCPAKTGDNPDSGSTTDDATVDSIPDVEASDWDPVWHLTAAKQWPDAPDLAGDCGPGCAPFFSAPVAGTGYYGFSFDTERAVHQPDRPPGVLLGRSRAGGATKLFGAVTGNEILIQPYVYGNRVAYQRSHGAATGEVEVMDLVTGETKVAYSYTPATAGKSNSVTRVALNSRYVFWAHDGVGIMSRDLLSGEVRLWQAGSWLCHDICATESELICAELGTVYSVNLASGAFGPMDPTGQLQVEGFCSPDRKQFVWIDYRDPPGPGSTYDFHRDGGEVYVRDLVTKHSRRVTFDSPASPKGKTYPAVAGNTVIWIEPPDGAGQNPEYMGDLYANAITLVRLDLSTGQKCRLNETPARFRSYKALYDQHLVANVLDQTGNSAYLGDFDMSSPDVTWTCEQVTIPP